MTEEDRENKIAFILNLLDKKKQLTDKDLREQLGKVFEITEQERMALLSLLHQHGFVTISKSKGEVVY